MIEQSIAEYLLLHQEGIKSVLSELCVESKTNPILKTYLNEAIVNKVILQLTSGLQLNYEEVAQYVDYDYIVNLLGKEFFNL